MTCKRPEFRRTMIKQPPVNTRPPEANARLARLFRDKVWSPEDRISLGLGDCTIPLPDGVRRACGEKLRRDGFVSYTPIFGNPDLRKALARDLPATYRTDLRDNQFIVSGGSRGALDDIIHVVAARFAETETSGRRKFEFGTFVPTWATYESLVQRVGRRITMRALPSDEKTVYDRLTASNLEWFLDLYPSVGAVIIANPHNPTGFALSAKEATEIMEVLADRGIFVIEDATYAKITFGQEGFNSLITAAYALRPELRDDVLTRTASVYGLQKLSLSGERISAIVAPHKDMLEPIGSNQMAGRGATAQTSQEIALALLEHGNAIPDIVDELAKRRVALAMARSEINALFAKQMRPRLCLGTDAHIPDLVAGSTLEGVAKDQNHHGGGFYGVLRFGDIIRKILPKDRDYYDPKTGELADDGLWKALLDLAIVTQPSDTMGIPNEPLVLRASFGDASVEQIQKLAQRLADGLTTNIGRLHEVLHGFHDASARTKVGREKHQSPPSI